MKTRWRALVRSRACPPHDQPELGSFQRASRLRDLSAISSLYAAAQAHQSFSRPSRDSPHMKKNPMKTTFVPAFPVAGFAWRSRQAAGILSEQAARAKAIAI